MCYSFAADELPSLEMQQEGLTQTDHASAFAVDSEIFVTPGLIAMQNLLVVSHTEFAHVRGPQNLGDAGSPPHLRRRG